MSHVRRAVACIDTATDAIPMTSAPYTGFGASSTHAAAASAHTSHTPACHDGRGAVVGCASGAAAVAARGCVVVAIAD